MPFLKWKVFVNIPRAPNIRGARGNRSLSLCQRHASKRCFSGGPVARISEYVFPSSWLKQPDESLIILTCSDLFSRGRLSEKKRPRTAESCGLGVLCPCNLLTNYSPRDDVIHSKWKSLRQCRHSFAYEILIKIPNFTRWLNATSMKRTLDTYDGQEINLLCW